MQLEDGSNQHGVDWTDGETWKRRGFWISKADSQNRTWALTIGTCFWHARHTRWLGRRNHAFRFASSLPLTLADFRVCTTSASYTSIPHYHPKVTCEGLERRHPRPSWCRSLYCGEHPVEESHRVKTTRISPCTSPPWEFCTLCHLHRWSMPFFKVSIRRLMPSQSISSGSCSPSSLPAALDTVTISPDGDESKISDGQHGPSETLCTLTFPVLHPTVLDLSTLLEVVNSHAPLYTLEEYQCYWYAGAA